MSGARARLFVALDLPDPVRDILIEWRTSLAEAQTRELRLIAPGALHVTLCFLGSRSEEEIDAITAACCGVTADEAPHLMAAEAVWLPRRRPRVLAVELDDPDGTLGRIQASLSNALAAGGWYEPERRPYLAHVTVARVSGRSGSMRGDRISGRGGARADPPAPPRLDFRGRRIVLYRSRVQRGGARYEALASVELPTPTDAASWHREFSNL